MYLSCICEALTEGQKLQLVEFISDCCELETEWIYFTVVQLREIFVL